MDSPADFGRKIQPPVGEAYMNESSVKSRKLGSRKGNAVLEFALAFVVLVPLFLGSFEFGYAFFAYNSLQSAVRSGARYASLRTYDSDTDTPTADFILAVQNTVVYGNPAGTGNPFVDGFAPSDVSVEMTFWNGRPWAVTVSIPEFETDAVVDMVQFAEKPRLTVPYSGRWAPEG